jgi:hypothetical protein
MSTLKLQTFQAEFAAALASGDPAARPKGFSSKAAARFRIYRNNYYHGLSQQLAEAYPVVRRLVGDEFFFATARAFLEAHAPRTRSLALFGGEFPSFLEEFPPAASLPYLPDVARLERARLEALHAADAAALAPAALAGQGQALAEVRFVAHPAARIVTSDYPIVDLWRANQPEVDPGRCSFESAAQSALITRPQLRVEVCPLSAAQAAFGRSLLAGEDVVAAFERASQTDECFDVTAAFRELLVAGAFAHMDSLAGE